MPDQNTVVTESFLDKWARRAPGISVTSDHLMTTNTFHTDEGVDLKISTFNLGNKFHSKANCHMKDAAGNGLYSNNPEDMDETSAQYIARKNQQIDDIMSHLTQAPTPVDALFLQEIDLLTFNGQGKRLALKQRFIDELRQNGYSLQMTTPTINAVPQAIIYRNDVLVPESNQAFSAHIPGTDVGGRKTKNTLFEGRFSLKGTNKKVCLASAHLDYEGDYSNALIQYSADRANDGYTTIWGGDTNHAPNHQIQGLIGNFKFATNYDLSSTNGDSTTLHENTTSQKTYDGFGGSAPKGIRLTVTEESPRLCFDKTDSGEITVRQVTANELGNHCEHTSLPGRPWQRRQSLVLDTLGFREKLIHQICGEQEEKGQIDLAYDILKKSSSTGEMMSALNKAGYKLSAQSKQLMLHAHSLTMPKGEAELIQRLDRTMHRKSTNEERHQPTPTPAPASASASAPVCAPHAASQQSEPQANAQNSILSFFLNHPNACTAIISAMAVAIVAVCAVSTAGLALAPAAGIVAAAALVTSALSFFASKSCADSQADENEKSTENTHTP